MSAGVDPPGDSSGSGVAAAAWSVLLRGRWALWGSIAFAMRALLVKLSGASLLVLLLSQMLLCAPLLWLACHRHLRWREIDGRCWRVHALRTAASVAANLCFLAALQQGPVSVAVCLAFTAPLWIELHEWTVTRRLALRSVASLLVALAGVATLGGMLGGTFDAATVSAPALLFGVLCGLGTAVTNLLTVRLRRHDQSEAQIIGWFTYLSVAAAALLLAGGWLLTLTTPWQPLAGLRVLADLSLRAEVSLLLIAAFALAGQSFMTRSVLSIGLRSSSLWNYTSVVWAMLLGLVLLGERADIAQALGTALVLAGSFLGLKVSRPLQAEAVARPL